MKRFLLAAFLLLGLHSTGWSQSRTPADLFLSLLQVSSEVDLETSLEEIESTWQDGYRIMVIETITLVRNPRVTQELIQILQEKTDLPTVNDLNDLYTWLWQEEEALTDDYAEFKAALYQLIDPKFEDYFAGHQEETSIRLDEIRWGGVLQDGIPPLRNPAMITASEADYLEDDHIVFGIEVNGDVRAYPKRILAWHEMFVDEVGGIPVAGVYCTLCGTVMLMETELNGVNHEIGTSGFLYRSNKLMYDKATQSLWNTFWGEPVVGPLLGSGIKLNFRSVVTTTWGKWKELHPETLVLSLETGHNRDYSEGAAYREYFATDELMFGIPFSDNRLNNKDEILALRFGDSPERTLAISADFLLKNRVYQAELSGVHFVVLTDETGANRVFERGNFDFKSFDGNGSAMDADGISWEVSEAELRNSETGETLDRLPYHRAFWFGWHAAYPDTKLIK